eukprot:jgi/Chlat1/8480/Chrsp80S07874
MAVVGGARSKRGRRAEEDDGDGEGRELGRVQGAAQAAELAAQKLAAYGEQFMRAFDDYDSEEERQKRIRSELAASVSAADDATSNEMEAEEEPELPDIPTRTVAAETPAPKRASKRDWKMFMSPRAADVHKESTTHLPILNAEDDSGLTPEEFQKLAKEVERLGGRKLEGKERKAWAMKSLVELGAKPAKSPRTPISRGLGIKRKQEDRERIKLDQDIASGMVRVKGSGKAKRAKENREKRQKLSKAERAVAGADRFIDGVMVVPKKVARELQKDTGNNKKKGKSVASRLTSRLFSERTSKKKSSQGKKKGKRNKHKQKKR